MNGSITVYTPLFFWISIDNKDNIISIILIVLYDAFIS